MSRSAEISKLKQEAALLRAVTVEKGILGRHIEEAAWERIARTMNLPATTCKSRWRTENNRLREMEEVLYASPRWESCTRPVLPASTREHVTRSDLPPAPPIRVRQPKRRRIRNPYPPLIIIPDDDSDVEYPPRLNFPSTTSITRACVERTQISHRRRHRSRASRTEMDLEAHGSLERAQVAAMRG